jgi:hypothetical protein
MSNPILIHTSGALTHDIAAWAFVTQYQGHEVHKYGCLQAAGDPLTGHHAALIKALEWAAEHQIKRLMVYTDSQAALDTLQTPPPAGSPLIASTIPLYLRYALEALGGTVAVGAHARAQELAAQAPRSLYPGLFAPRDVTCKQFRDRAKQKGWRVEWLIEQVKGQIESPAATIKRLMGLAEPSTVIPYPMLIDLYHGQAQTAPKRGECRCRCGQRVMGRQKFASDACRKRAARRAA